MSTITQVNMAQVLDRNKDNILQRNSEIKISDAEFKVLDLNQDQELSTDELSTAIAQDHVLIQYKTNEAAVIRLNPEKFEARSNDKSQGYIYGGVLLGAGAGAGIGALIALGTGNSASSGAQVGMLAGAISGAISSGVLTYLYHHPETTYETKDPAQEPDPQTVKKYALGGSATGATLGAVAGYFVFGKTGLMSTKTALFAGGSIGATIGMGVGNAIGTHQSLKQKNP